METGELLHLQKMINELNGQLTEIKGLLNSSPKEKMESDCLNEFYTALSKAQGEFSIAGKKQVNTFYKSNYSDFCEVVSAAREALQKHGLSVMQDIMQDDAGQWLYTIVSHSSGQFRKSRIRILPSKTDIHGWKSHITYIKRTCFESMLNIVSHDEDDDGEEDMHGPRNDFKEGTKLEYQAKQTPEGETPLVINKTELDDLLYELDGWPDILNNILKSWNLRSLADMPKIKYRTCKDQIMKIKAARKAGQDSR